MTETLIAAFVTLFVVVDPVGVAPMFAALTPANTAKERRAIALRGKATGGGVLLFFALVGEPFLGALGIVTAALAVQFMIDGARAVWPGV